MKLDEVVDFKYIVDREIVYLINKKKFLKLDINTIEWDEHISINMLEELLDLLSKHDKLYIGLYKDYYTIKKWKWNYRILIWYEEKYQVVNKEVIRCVECKEKIVIINPTIDIARRNEYYERKGIYNDFGYEQIKCPKCKADLKRYGILIQ